MVVNSSGKVPFNSCKAIIITSSNSVFVFEQVHVSKESSIADHCRVYALSDPTDLDFHSSCSHEHIDLCDRCNKLKSVLEDIDEAITRVSDDNTDVKEELTFVTIQAKQNITAWKAHLLRSINQDEARINAVDALDQTSVLLVQDWAMKFLPRKYRESQTDWFGKRGLSWHITVAICRTERNELHMMTFVHVFQTCNQDSCTVLSIMKDVLSNSRKSSPSWSPYITGKITQDVITVAHLSWAQV